MDNINRLKAAISAALGLLTALWGWFGWLVVAWVAAMGLDIGTGMAAALKTGTWSSSIARDGLWHKVGSISAVLACGLLDLVFGALLENTGLAGSINYTVLLCPLAIMWYLITEAGSIVENSDKLGARIPSWLRKAIASLEENVDHAGGEDDTKADD